jgi:hypothetical protein
MRDYELRRNENAISDRSGDVFLLVTSQMLKVTIDSCQRVAVLTRPVTLGESVMLVERNDLQFSCQA